MIAAHDVEMDLFRSVQYLLVTVNSAGDVVILDDATFVPGGFTLFVLFAGPAAVLAFKFCAYDAGPVGFVDCDPLVDWPLCKMFNGILPDGSAM